MDGQNGPEPAPSGAAKRVQIDAKIAARLAFYKSNYDDGLLAPRGWHCVALEGSNGSLLFVMPQARTGEDLLLHHTTIAGPAIQFAVRFGGTSGQFDVAQIIARYFPKRRAYVDSIISEGIEPASDFPTGPFPGDIFVSRSDRAVVVDTPPGVSGLGSKSRLVPDALSVRSVVILDGDAPDLLQLTVKLPSDQRDLLPVIMGQLR